jgi:tRNA(fMet)-specific endonuclease VapC
MTRKFMLDTDTVSYVFRGEGRAGENLTARAPSELCISSLCLSELRYGAEKRRSKRLHRLIDVFTSTVDVVPFDGAAASEFGRVCFALESKGSPIGVFDTLIAAHALSLGLTLITNNAKRFARIRELRTENWLRGE